MNGINNIEIPIELRHTEKRIPNAVLHFGVPLNNRQRKLLDSLPEYDSKITVSKNNVSMKDLAALTAETGDEFAMFTKSETRLIIRGNSIKVEIDEDLAMELNSQGFR